jgi:hydroxyacylglutathione hydrolase
MLLKYFYDSDLAHASYMVGCQRTGEALIIDPARDITPYLQTASQEEMIIVGTAETHIHADYVSGSRELAASTGATLYLSDEGDENWKYTFATAYKHQLLKDGDSFMVGNVKLDVMHTPGHTPESISFVLTDMGGGATDPMGIFTGDFVFVGSIGRPDLLEKAAGIAGTSAQGALAMYDSIQRFKQLPDYLQVWPAHGAGSACGKGLGAVPSSTVGYEKRFNASLNIEDKEDFVEALLEGQPEPPKYFAVMKRVNKEGPTVLGDYNLPTLTDPHTIHQFINDGEMVIDTNSAENFAKAHVPGTINVPLVSLASWAGWFINYDKPVNLVTAPQNLAQAVRILHEIGVDDVAHYFDPDAVAEAGLNNQTYAVKSPTELAAAILNNEVTLIDVRAQTEWDEGHLPNAQHIMLGYLPENAQQFIDGKPIVMQCRSGARSAIAASIMQAAGATEVVNMMGGYRDWKLAGLPVES